MFGFASFAELAFAELGIVIIPPVPNYGVTFGVTFPVASSFNGVSLQVTAQKN